MLFSLPAGEGGQQRHHQADARQGGQGEPVPEGIAGGADDGGPGGEGGQGVPAGAVAGQGLPEGEPGVLGGGRKRIAPGALQQLGGGHQGILDGLVRRVQLGALPGDGEHPFPHGGGDVIGPGETGDLGKTIPVGALWVDPFRLVGHQMAHAGLQQPEELGGGD